MLNYERLKNRARLLRAFTGLNPKAFHHLLRAFARAYEAWLDEQERQRAQPRQRRRGGGRIGQLPHLADKLLFILFYFRQYPTQEALGFFFGLSQSQANYWIQTLTPLLNSALGYEAQLPAREPSKAEQVLAACDDLRFIIDGTERPIQRPKDRERQKQYYSGKKKRHTVKNIIITDQTTKQIKVLGPTVEGKQHDKKAADEQAYQFPEGSHLWQDTGFQGYAPDNTTTHQPKKKPKNGQLTADEKAHNRLISSERMGVEHSIGGAKVFRIVRDVLRHRLPGFADLAMETSCGLHNLRLDFPVAA